MCDVHMETEQKQRRRAPVRGKRSECRSLSVAPAFSPLLLSPLAMPQLMKYTRRGSTHRMPGCRSCRGTACPGLALRSANRPLHATKEMINPV